MTWPVPARIETARLVLRRYEPERDTEAYHARLVEDADHLRPWMPWAEHEPLSLDEHRAWLEQCAAWAADGTKAFLGMFDRATGAYLGSAGLHPLEDGRGLEVGYWIGASHEGRGLVTEAVKALTLVALLHAGAPVVELYQRPANQRSGAVARRAGFTFLERTSDTHEGVEMDRWAADATALSREPLASSPLPRLADVDGTVLRWRLWSIPARIETERLVLRCYEPSDTAELHAAIDTNLAHLRRFIPWARNEPLTYEQRVALVSEYARAFDAGDNFRFAMLDRATGALIGGVGLHTRVGPDALEIGYWIAAEREGEGLISEAVRALTRTALAGGASRVEIWCDMDNSRSSAVAARCGYTSLGARVRDGETLHVWSFEPDRDS